MLKRNTSFSATQHTRTALDANSVEYGACKDIYCDFEATCELGPDNFPRCTCKFECNSTSTSGNLQPTSSKEKPVCASDLRLYPSLCAMKLESCQRQEELRLRPLDLCQGSLLFGRALSALSADSTGSALGVDFNVCEMESRTNEILYRYVYVNLHRPA